ncbi:unnamed protein product [Rodentolepis nana]|uniref:Reverse transcriptase domain-containing protein n=1 Tax=Rodentolepis nana TaxID=102285 RepID=A0A0R3T9P0_RODNA|nr:unnamed protein product [Rodentolepis nana]
MLEGCHLDPPVECWRDVTGQKGPSTAVTEGNVSGQKDPSTENPKNSQVKKIQIQKILQTYDVAIFTIMEANISDAKTERHQRAFSSWLQATSVSILATCSWLQATSVSIHAVFPLGFKRHQRAYTPHDDPGSGHKPVIATKVQKSPGEDGIHAEFLIRMGPTAKETMLTLFNKIWETSLVYDQRYGNALSKSNLLQTDIPLGAVIGCTLFNVFINDIAELLQSRASSA